MPTYNLPKHKDFEPAKTECPGGQSDCKYCTGELPLYCAEYHGPDDKRLVAWRQEQDRFERGMWAALVAAPAALLAIIWNATGWTGILFTVGILFVIWCMIVDSFGHGKGEFWAVVCRIIGSHAKLAFKVAWGILLYFGALLGCTMLLKPEEESVSNGGPQSEELAGFLNTLLYFPRMILRAIVGVGRFFLFIGALLMIWLTEFLLNHMTLFFATLAVLYVYWGVCKIHRIVREEYADPGERAKYGLLAVLIWAPLAACVLQVLIGLAIAGSTSHIAYANLW